MEITFLTLDLRDLCEKRADAVVRLGYAASRELADRLADIEAVGSVSELAEILGALVADEGPTEKSLRLNTGFRLVFRSAHPVTHESKKSVVDWKQVTRIKILGIEPANG